MLADLFRESHEPLFLNEGPFPSERTLEEMEALRPRVTKEDAKRLDWDIRLMKAGIRGEKRIAFELQNSHYPIVFIHDLNLEFEGARAQIDFLVLSPFFTYVIECKNLYGNIEVGKDGSFVRAVGSGSRKRREGMYSPVTQNARHIELMKTIDTSGAGRLRKLMYSLIDAKKPFYHSLIVLANDKTVVATRYAPEEIRKQIIRCDQLVEHIRQHDRIAWKSNQARKFDEIKQEAEYWLSLSKPVETDLTDRYELKPAADSQATAPKQHAASGAPNAAPSATPDSTQQSTTPFCPICGSPMELRIARYGKRKGKQFWGCSNYWSTGCRGIINIG